jgi:hypothetical protein
VILPVSTTVLFLYIIHRPVFKKRRTVYFCVLDKDRTMDRVQKHHSCTHVPLSQTFTSYVTRCFVCMWYLFCHTKGRAQIEDAWEERAKNIWRKEEN